MLRDWFVHLIQSLASDESTKARSELRRNLKRNSDKLGRIVRSALRARDSKRPVWTLSDTPARLADVAQSEKERVSVYEQRIDALEEQHKREETESLWILSVLAARLAIDVPKRADRDRYRIIHKALSETRCSWIMVIEAPAIRQRVQRFRRGIPSPLRTKVLYNVLATHYEAFKSFRNWCSEHPGEYLSGGFHRWGTGLERNEQIMLRALLEKKLGPKLSASQSSRGSRATHFGHTSFASAPRA